MRKITPRKSWHWQKHGVALFLLVALSGCGSSTGTVTGKVSYKGEALRRGNVLFVAAGGWTGSALINEDGTYRIANLPPGSFKLAVEPAGGPTQGGRGRSGPPRGKWGPPKDAAVPEGFKGADHDVPANAASVNVPAKYAKVETSELTCEVKRGKQTHDIDLK
jgi:hypothetical protein